MKDTRSKVEATLIMFASGIIGPEEACDRIMSAFDYSRSSDKIVCPECESESIDVGDTWSRTSCRDCNHVWN